MELDTLKKANELTEKINRYEHMMKVYDQYPLKFNLSKHFKIDDELKEQIKDLVQGYLDGLKEEFSQL